MSDRLCPPSARWPRFSSIYHVSLHPDLSRLRQPRRPEISRSWETRLGPRDVCRRGSQNSGFQMLRMRPESCNDLYLCPLCFPCRRAQRRLDRPAHAQSTFVHRFRRSHGIYSRCVTSRLQPSILFQANVYWHKPCGNSSGCGVEGSLQVGGGKACVTTVHCATAPSYALRRRTKPRRLSARFIQDHRQQCRSPLVAINLRYNC